jgi:predicted PhzF superfamily epimerase YddE/YHI9
VITAILGDEVSMGGISVWQVDAFTDWPFFGNPAAVCLLDEERDARWMQAVALEMNLSETAFVQKVEDDFGLRWFTPAVEVDLCGHATLAAAHTLWQAGIVRAEETIRFRTRSGVLTAARDAGLVWLDFPATPARECLPLDGLLAALGVEPTFVGKTSFDMFVVVASDAVVRSIAPDFRQLGKIAARGVIVTAASDDRRFDFVSRFFAPAAGIDEDPVTGSAHCALAPYWGERLGKREMVGYQASARGGTVHVKVDGDRVMLGGEAVTVMKGALCESGGR